MRTFIATLTVFFVLGSQAHGMVKMAANELKKTTAQIASTAGHAGDVAAPVAEVSEHGGRLYGGYLHADRIQPATTEAIGVARTALEPVSRVVNIGSDANGFKSGVSLGAF